MDWLWNLLGAIFRKGKPNLDALPDDQEIPDAQADAIVGTVDDTDPVPLEEGDPDEVPAAPANDPHFGEDDVDADPNDPDVVVTVDPEDGSVYSDDAKVEG